MASSGDIPIGIRVLRHPPIQHTMILTNSTAYSTIDYIIVASPSSPCMTSSLFQQSVRMTRYDTSWINDLESAYFDERIRPAMERSFPGVKLKKYPCNSV